MALSPIITTAAECLDQNKPTPLSCIPFFFGNIINFMFGFAGVVASFFIIISGIRFLTAGGDMSKVEQAKKSLTWSVAGLVIILLSFTIIKAISVISGSDCILGFGIGCE